MFRVEDLEVATCTLLRRTQTVQLAEASITFTRPINVTGLAFIGSLPDTKGGGGYDDHAQSNEDGEAIVPYHYHNLHEKSGRQNAVRFFSFWRSAAWCRRCPIKGQGVRVGRQRPICWKHPQAPRHAQSAGQRMRKGQPR